MNYTFKSVAAIILIITCSDLHSQVRPQFIIGLNFSTMTLKTNGIESVSKMLPGVHYGAFIEIQLERNFKLQPSLLFTAKGSDYIVDTSEVSVAPIYLELSVYPVYTFGSGDLKVSLFAGPYLACGVGGYKIESGGEIRDLTYGSREGDDLKPFDIGINFGAGINIKGFLFSAQYGIGLVNLFPSGANDIQMKNKVIGISISSMFEGR